MDSPPASPVLSDPSLKGILADFGRTVVNEVKAFVRDLEATCEGRFNATDLKLNCKHNLLYYVCIM